MPRRILSPVQRIFDPVVGDHESRLASLNPIGLQWGGREVCDSIFSDFPTIESAISVDELSFSFFTHRLSFRREMPVVVFCHHPIRRRRRGSARQVQSRDSGVLR